MTMNRLIQTWLTRRNLCIEHITGFLVLELSFPSACIEALNGYKGIYNRYILP